MALLGGGVGGAGNPVGGSFTGPAQALEIIGDHAYAYSGGFPASSTVATRLKFTTGNYLFVGEIRMAGMVDLATASGGSIMTMGVTMNGQTVLVGKCEGADERMPTSDVVPFIIPAYTEVEVTQDAQNDDVNFTGTISMTGRIYRTRD